MDFLELRERFNPDDSLLRQHQLRMLEILDHVDAVCKKHHIDYWLCSGTLLGAVRHGAFIPWDDDLDIEMNNKDIPLFIKAFERESSDKYVIQNHNTDKAYVAPYIKIRDTKSKIYEHNNVDMNYKYKGIFIDIFPLEKTNKYCLAIASYLHVILYLLIRIKHDRFGFLKHINSLYFFILTRILYPFFRLFPKHTYTITYGTMFRAPRDINDIFPLKSISFEGKEYSAPRNPDKYLSKIYGDYMKLPDLEKIIKHTNKIVIE